MGAAVAATDHEIKPSRWRKQHGRVERAIGEDGAQIVDAEGNIGDPYRGLSMLEQWERAGRISREMRMAGDKFHEVFQLACLDPLYAADMSRVGGSPAPAKHRGSILARDDVRDALAALGGPDTPAACGAWFVLGCEFSIREWAIREGWRGRVVDQKVAAGILIGCLGTLAKHFGY